MIVGIRKIALFASQKLQFRSRMQSSPLRENVLEISRNRKCFEKLRPRPSYCSCCKLQELWKELASAPYIASISKHLIMILWICHTEKGWISYSATDNSNIEAAYKANLSTFDLNLNGNSYIINFEKMEQINRKTSLSRSVQRISPNVIVAWISFSNLTWPSTLCRVGNGFVLSTM